MQEIKQLLDITKKLREQYNRSFSLDGKLVGDIGEVLASKKYAIKLYDDKNIKDYDGEEEGTGRKVQIKASFHNNCYFPGKVIPDYFLAVNIGEDGSLMRFTTVQANTFGTITSTLNPWLIIAAMYYLPTN